MDWTTGGHRTSRTFIEVEARHHPEYIERMVAQELAAVRRLLSDRGIRTPELQG